MFAFWQTRSEPTKAAETFGTDPATNVGQDKTVPLPPEARQIAVQFIKTAVVRKNLRDAWTISGPGIKQDLSLNEWMTGNIPVVPYLDAAVNASPVKVDGRTRTTSRSRSSCSPSRARRRSRRSSTSD